jgi:hypothetical protein
MVTFYTHGQDLKKARLLLNKFKITSNEYSENTLGRRRD